MRHNQRGNKRVNKNPSANTSNFACLDIIHFISPTRMKAAMARNHKLNNHGRLSMPALRMKKMAIPDRQQQVAIVNGNI